MKRTPVLIAALALLAGGLGHDAMAATKKKPAPPKPVITTLFLHGTSQYGNQDMFTGDDMTLDRKAPTGTTTKEAAVVGGNADGALFVPKDCPGGPYIADFQGPLSGTMTGSMTVKFFARGTGGNVTVQLIADPDADCTADPVIAAEVLAPVPASPSASLVTVKVPLGPKGVKVLGNLSVQFLSDETTTPGAFGISGISYDSTATPSSVTFSCLPKPGKKAC